ncbi:MAG: phosphoglycerate kinase [Candidatus Freyarchaeum deiterrae]
MDKEFYTMSDFDFSGKTVLLRVDFNSAVDPNTKAILDDSRIRDHVPTLKELVKKGAKVVVLAHQGRKGDYDFISLEPHAKILGKLLGKPVGFVDDVYGDKAKNAIKNLKKGDILVLQNVRFTPDEKADLPPEKLADTDMVRTLSKLADYYVNDAFSAAHRADASLVAFDQVLPAMAGRLMERELENLEKVSKDPEKPSVYVLGGTKVEDTFTIVKYVLEENIATNVLTTGLVANTYLLAEGHDLGEVNNSLIEKKGHLTYLSPIKEVLDKFRDKIELPEDLAYDDGGKRVEIDVEKLPVEKPIKDIGSKSIEKYSKIIQNAKTIVCNGPPGMFEEQNFEMGTKKIFQAITQSKAFSLVGGGHTTAALRKYGLEKKVSYSTTAGGAFISYLSGEKLPAVEALKEAYEKKKTSK